MNTTPAHHPTAERFFAAVAAALVLGSVAISGALVIDHWLAIAFALVLVFALVSALLAMTSDMLSDDGDED